MRLIVNGIETYAATGGSAFDPARPVVFVHGAGLDRTVWVLLSRWFAHHGSSVLAPDLPGHGRSAGALLGSIAAMADWTVALVDAAGAAGETDRPLHGIAGGPGGGGAPPRRSGAGLVAPLPP